MTQMQRITTCLWFDNQAEEAVQFYTSIFKNSKILHVFRYGEAGYEIHGQPAGQINFIDFELDGQTFTAMNGGPFFKFNEAISLQVHCATQAEVDYYWEKLSEGGDENAQQCGWLKDKYGLSWQVIPMELLELINDPVSPRSQRVYTRMLQMKKLDIVELRHLYET
ncbi:MAG: VOC family protein [Anaerolineales bacterium]|nr:MAG: VOC family protein [Anaerolineales bacterium]